MFINYLNRISNLSGEPLPLQLVLENSSYYAACNEDGGVMKYLNRMKPELQVLSHIMVDYHMDRPRLLDAVNTIRGYHIHSHRPLTYDELAPQGWQMPQLTVAELEKMERHRCFMKEPFAEWILLERDADMDSSHGPERMSLIYICGDGAATYHALYCTQQIAPTLLAIIQPGHGFGFNWVNFFDVKGALYRLASQNAAGMPKFLLFGPDEDSRWPGYAHIDKIHHYYPNGRGTCDVYERKMDDL